MTRVVHLTSVHPPFDNRIFHKQCKSLANAGYSVTLIAPHTHDELVDGIQIRAISKTTNRWIRIVKSWAEIYRRAAREQGDLYHFHDPELLPVGVLLRLRTGKPVIYDIHEDYVASFRQRLNWAPFFREMVSRITSVVEPLLANFCTVVLAERYYARRFPAGHPILNYSSIKTIVTPQAQTAPSEPRRKRLLYTGWVGKDRGALLYAEMIARDPHLEIDVIGRYAPELKEEMIALAGDGADRLHIIGGEQGVPFGRIVAAYQSGEYLAGLAVFPPTAHYVEKELTKFYEYMAAGLPVIYSAFPTWSALLDPHRVGIGVDPTRIDDVLRAVHLLQANSALAIWMGQNGRKAVMENYSWESEERKLVSLYRSLLDSA